MSHHRGLTRRALLASAGIAAVGASGLGCRPEPSTTTSTTSPEPLDAPSGDALARLATTHATSDRAAGVIALVVSAHPWLRMPPNDLARFADELVTHSAGRIDEATYVQRTVLLSTDLFEHGDDTRPLRYVRLFHPYATPCYSPLTRPPAPT